MLRLKKLVERLRAAHGGSSLAQLYWQLPKSERLRCKPFGDEISHVWQKSACNIPLSVSALEMERVLFLGLCSENHSMIWSVAENIKRGRERENNGYMEKHGTSEMGFYINPGTYLLLMLLIVQAQSKAQVPLALQLFQEFSLLRPERNEFLLACKLLFSAAEFCDDFTLLFDLRLVLENSPHFDLPGLEQQYAAATLSILLNSGQYSLAVTFLEDSLSEGHSGLPMKKFWAAACAARDCRGLADLLEACLSEVGVILAEEWMRYLGLGLAQNHHKLVKVVYGAMGNISLSPSTLALVVQVFATHGDVEKCTQIIEDHYLYLKGERALTKELSISIIQAYCLSSQSDYSSWYSALDVISAFSEKLLFFYQDIADAVLKKLNHVDLGDEKVEWARKKELYRVKQQLESREAELEEMEAEEQNSDLHLPKKATNSNVHSGNNTLQNMNVLLEFAVHTFRYMREKNFSASVVRLILNCLLSHLTVYQNLSAVVHFLKTIKEAQPECISVINSELYDIIFQAVSRSPASVRCGLHLFLRVKPLSQHHMESLIISSLRGLAFNSLLEFYCYEMLLRGFVPSEYIILRISKHKQQNERTKSLISVLQNLPQDYEEKWAKYEFQKSIHGLQMPELHGAYTDFDKRDCKILEMILDDCVSLKFEE